LNANGAVHLPTLHSLLHSSTFNSCLSSLHYPCDMPLSIGACDLVCTDLFLAFLADSVLQRRHSALAARTTLFS
jgi:hypothetical protein